MAEFTEFAVKMQRVEALLAQHKLDALVLRRVSSFAWATCGGADYVNTASSEGVATLVIRPGERHLLTDRIEAPRLTAEEVPAEQGWNVHVAPWHAGAGALEKLTGGLRVGADVALPGATNLAGEVSALRTLLLPEEQARFRELGRICAEAMNAAIRAVQPGQTEQEIAGRLAYETQRRGAQPIVALIATDERIFRFRHPVPALDKEMERYAMLVLCGRRRGLVASVTRLVHFGPLPDEVRRKMEATARVDAAFIAATRPGAMESDVFRAGQAAYAAAGFADEWQLHHQGGPAAYEPREWTTTPASTARVVEGQVYAWNPSITGAKSEDTVLVGAQGNEVLTTIPGWPMLTVEAGGASMARPAILELEGE
jgi:antitoxin VapB